MPIKVVRHPDSPNLYLRGSVRGHRVYETTGTADPAAAEALRIRKEKELLDRSIYGERVTRSFAAAALAYMEAPGATLREGRFIFPLVDALGQMTLEQITQERLDEYVARRFKGRAPSTILRNVITPVTTVLNFAARRKWCDAPSFDRPKQPAGRKRWATYEEAGRLINAASPHIQRLIIFLLWTGARMGEAMALEWSDIDDEQGWLVFRDTKRGEDRGVPLFPALHDCLLPRASGRVFRTPRGLEYAVRDDGGGQIKTGWRGTTRRAGINDLRPHDLRHTFSTWLTMAGVHEQVRDELMGHASTSMGRRYSHVPRQSLVEAVARLPRLDIVGENRVNKKQTKPIYAIVPTLYIK
jgi:integrase